MKDQKSDTILYHLILIKSNDSCLATIKELPAFVDIKRKDTAYSASDGGFRNGAGFITIIDEAIKIEGKYTKSYYTGIGVDSSLGYFLRHKKEKYIDDKSGLVFQKITDSLRLKLMGKWGISEFRMKPKNK